MHSYTQTHHNTFLTHFIRMLCTFLTKLVMQFFLFKLRNSFPHYEIHQSFIQTLSLVTYQLHCQPYQHIMLPWKHCHHETLLLFLSNFDAQSPVYQYTWIANQSKRVNPDCHAFFPLKPTSFFTGQGAQYLIHCRVSIFQGSLSLVLWICHQLILFHSGKKKKKNSQITGFLGVRMGWSKHFLRVNLCCFLLLVIEIDIEKVDHDIKIMTY